MGASCGVILPIKTSARSPVAISEELGKIVAAALNQPEKAGDGQHLALASDYVCWQDLVDISERPGASASSMSGFAAEEYDGFFPSAREFRHMMSVLGRKPLFRAPG